MNLIKQIKIYKKQNIIKIKYLLKINYPSNLTTKEGNLKSKLFYQHLHNNHRYSLRPFYKIIKHKLLNL